MKRLLVLAALVAAACGNEPAKKSAPTTLCGNGELNPGESCDPFIALGNPGACPAECVAGACQVASLTGNPLSCTARCVVAPVACGSGDGCCPVGCDSSNDAECVNTCGDGVVNGPETCDGNCPSDCGDYCNGLDFSGSASACSARCEAGEPIGCVDGDGCCPVGCTSDVDDDCSPAAACGNGVVDEGESCDGNCPTTCASPGQCRVARLSGAAATCDAACVAFDVTSCANGDGCCPSNCTAQNDSDCSATCGNGSVDTGETCDGNCPTSCTKPNACTRADLKGSAANCSVFCEFSSISACVSGDGCCPQGCSTQNDSDCSCTKKTCAQAGAECGEVGDGCGGTLSCGGCTGGKVCSRNSCETPGGGSVGSVCGSNSDCDSDLFCDVGLSGTCTKECDFTTVSCPSGSSCGALGSGMTSFLVCARECSSNADCEGTQTCQAPVLPFVLSNICM